MLYVNYILENIYIDIFLHIVLILYTLYKKKIIMYILFYKFI